MKRSKKQQRIKEVANHNISVSGVQSQQHQTANPETINAPLVQGSPDKSGATTERLVILPHSSMLKELIKELRPINFHERAALSDGEALTKQHYVIITVEELLSVARMKDWSLCMNDGVLFAYNGACWKQVSKADLKHFLGEAAEAFGVNIYTARYHALREDLLKQFRSTAYLPIPEKDNDAVYINFANGTFVITPEKQYLRPFDRSDFLLYQLPFSYDPDAKAPLFQQFLDRVLPDKTLQMILAEYVASVFIKNKTLKLEKFLILYGGGANGKSVVFEVITALLGPENVSNYSLQSLTNENGYYRAKLKNVLLNYASEISPKMDINLFKHLVSGEPVEARQIYAEPFTLVDYARLIFNTNELPHKVEQTEAFYRRFMIIPFNVTIPEEERNPELATKITSSELPGVFNWVMDGLYRLLKQKRFTHSDVVDAMVKQYREQSDTVHLFLTDEGIVPDNEQSMALKVLFNDYKSYCLESGYRPCSLKLFSERLKHKGIEMVRRNRGNVVFVTKKQSE